MVHDAINNQALLFICYYEDLQICFLFSIKDEKISSDSWINCPISWNIGIPNIILLHTMLLII